MIGFGLIKGLSVTLRNLFGPVFTIQYPDKRVGVFGLAKSKKSSVLNLLKSHPKEFLFALVGMAKVEVRIEQFPRFRGNLYVEGISEWEERNWINKIIKINKTSFKVEKNIPRCVAINLKPNTDDNSLNLLNSLKKTYNHFDMGVYLTALEDGKVNVGDRVELI